MNDPAVFAIYPISSHRELERICEDHGIHMIHPRRDYQRYEKDPHPTAEGNRSMALDIVDQLLEWDTFMDRVP